MPPTNLEQRVSDLEFAMQNHQHKDSDLSHPTELKVAVGAIASGGSATFLPKGWTSSKVSTGLYEVVHGKGSDRYAVFYDGGGGATEVLKTSTKNVNYFRVSRYVGGTLTDGAFYFTLITN